jgi:sortase A
MKRSGLTGTIAAAMVLFLAGTALVAYPFLTDVRYEYAQWRLGTGEALAAETPQGEAMPEGAVARLEIPDIGIDAYVVEGTDTSALAEGPGHYPETPTPGEAGNVGIAGHRTMYGAVFHDLDQLAAGDVIRTYTTSRSATYRVVEVIVVDPSQVDVVAPTEGSRLTLTTCHPIGSAAQRLVVVAELVE